MADTFWYGWYRIEPVGNQWGVFDDRDGKRVGRFSDDSTTARCWARQRFIEDRI